MESRCSRQICAKSNEFSGFRRKGLCDCAQHSALARRTVAVCSLREPVPPFSFFLIESIPWKFAYGSVGFRFFQQAMVFAE